jgi:hypothetical protein
MLYYQPEFFKLPEMKMFLDLDSAERRTGFN